MGGWIAWLVVHHHSLERRYVCVRTIGLLGNEREGEVAHGLSSSLLAVIARSPAVLMWRYVEARPYGDNRAWQCSRGSFLAEKLFTGKKLFSLQW